jgi:hypothetical protein
MNEWIGLSSAPAAVLNFRGWGFDLDPAVRPGVPRDKAPELGAEWLYPPFPAQEPRVKIHKSRSTRD